VPVDLDLEKVLGDMPRKTYNFTRSQPQLQPHHLPQGTPHTISLMVSDSCTQLA